MGTSDLQNIICKIFKGFGSDVKAKMGGSAAPMRIWYVHTKF
jgi:hypothetical protein